MKSWLSAEQQRRWRAFRASRRGVYSLWLLGALVLLSLLAELVANSRPLVVRYEAQWYWPLWNDYPETTFGGDLESPTDYGDPYLVDLLQAGENWALFPPIPWDYRQIDYDLSVPTPSPPDASHWLGTDDRGRDVLARLIYGLRVSIFFGLVLALVATLLGMLIGAVQGFFGGWIDLAGQRLIEIWSALPELYLLIILSATFTASIPLLIALLSLFGWMGLSVYVRAEFLKARQLDYVKAARALGVPRRGIMLRHIVPNTLTPVVTFFPFRVSAAIIGLTSLDFLNLGVPSPTPSLGELLRQAKGNVDAWWLSLSTFAVLVLMIVIINFVGESLLRALDPRRQGTMPR